ncbi:hypothetical protein CABS01_16543 [Colletotrichum abscissum]|uniref:uncharacterized protein n=1 Tax=Colletotrichum abscissum TaxID=1671311 RepID=UPI0027D57194|nr:uncharacterized protein CABS01_16543 [Colletotrichum abscissum]KAK1521567.1 hypothetical protein CABS01_16543 [Colletotrichum abscissum]
MATVSLLMTGVCDGIVGEDQWRQASKWCQSNESNGPDDPISLICTWLRCCDAHHKDLPPALSEGHEDCRASGSNELPTRLIDLSSLTDESIQSCYSNSSDSTIQNEPHTVTIAEAGQLKKGTEYVALSHRWGDPSNDYAPEKYQLQKSGNARFSFRDLPKTFQHAIIVTKRIGKEFLWIDSLCINQSDEADWARESKKMNKVFKNAYCTIAATSAKDFTEGFLDGGGSAPSPTYWKDQFPEDFEKSVEESVLNKRAWVLQERALSRRIVHFTEKRTFWECGAVAIKSLASELAKVFALGRSSDGRVENGIFSAAPYSQQSLLWYLITPAGPIDFSGIKVKKPPTWSWMAYEGSIDYLDIGEHPDWDTAIKFSENAVRLSARVAKISGVIPFAGTNDNRETIYHQGGNEVGRAWFDYRTPKTSEGLQCALLGKAEDQQKGRRRYYVLLLLAERNAPLERLGVGWFYESAIDFAGVDELEIV